MTREPDPRSTDRSVHAGRFQSDAGRVVSPRCKRTAFAGDDRLDRTATVELPDCNGIIREAGREKFALIDPESERPGHTALSIERSLRPHPGRNTLFDHRTEVVRAIQIVDAVDTTTSRMEPRPSPCRAPSGSRFSDPLRFVHAVVPVWRSMRDTAPLPNVIRYRPSSDPPRRSPYSVLHCGPGNVASTSVVRWPQPAGRSSAPLRRDTHPERVGVVEQDRCRMGRDRPPVGWREQSVNPTIEPSAVAKTSTRLPVATTRDGKHVHRQGSARVPEARTRGPSDRCPARERNGHRRGNWLSRCDVMPRHVSASPPCTASTAIRPFPLRRSMVA